MQAHVCTICPKFYLEKKSLQSTNDYDDIIAWLPHKVQHIFDGYFLKLSDFDYDVTITSVFMRDVIHMDGETKTIIVLLI